MNTPDTTQVAGFAELINEYGFMIIFATASLLTVFSIACIFIKRWDLANKSRLETEQNKNNLEIELSKKRTESEIEQNSKMFDLLTTVQTEQVSQMQNISEVMQLLKRELNETRDSISYSTKQMNMIEHEIKELLKKYDGSVENTKKIFNYIKQSNVSDKEIKEKLDKLLDLLEQKLN